MRMSSCAGSAAVMWWQSSESPEGRRRTVYRTAVPPRWQWGTWPCERNWHRGKASAGLRGPALPELLARRVGPGSPSRRSNHAMRVLVCGGAGYTGSHACTVLAARGHDLLVADSFVNSSPHVLGRLARIIGHPVPFRLADLRVRAEVDALFEGPAIDAVVHFAALKAVGESCERPLDYFENNISGTIHLLRAMQHAGVKRLVFSSSATVYGDPE